MKYEEGMEIRKKVLGQEHVERSMQKTNKFTADIQQLVTEYCWGEIWSNDEISHRDRSLINLAMLTALNRPHEFKVHVRGAWNNGCTEEEIKAVLLQTAVYCGVPAALESFRLAEEVLQDLR